MLNPQALCIAGCEEAIRTPNRYKVAAGDGEDGPQERTEQKNFLHDL